MVPENCVILCHYEGSFFDPYKCESNVIYTYDDSKIRSLSFFKKFCRKFDFLTGIVSLGYSNAWTSRVKEIDNWILIDSNRGMERICRFIKHHNKKAKVYYASIDCDFPLNEQKYCDGTACWDPEKARQWNARFIPLCYYYKPIQYNISNEYSYLWLGREKKERSDDLLDEIHSALETCYCGKKKGFWLTLKPGEKGLSYINEYLPMLNNSDVIVEIVRDDQSGLTLRALEAMFYDKKLITTNIHIKDYDFYNKNNIFIWGVDSDLVAWSKLPVQPVSYGIKESYTVEKYIKKIIGD